MCWAGPKAQSKRASRCWRASGAPRKRCTACGPLGGRSCAHVGRCSSAARGPPGALLRRRLAARVEGGPRWGGRWRLSRRRNNAANRTSPSPASPRDGLWGAPPRERLARRPSFAPAKSSTISWSATRERARWRCARRATVNCAPSTKRNTPGAPEPYAGRSRKTLNVLIVAARARIRTNSDDPRPGLRGASGRPTDRPLQQKPAEAEPLEAPQRSPPKPIRISSSWRGHLNGRLKSVPGGSLLGNVAEEDQWMLVLSISAATHGVKPR